MPAACGAIDNSSVLDPTLDTMPKMLSRAGYETVLVGKMHFRGTNQFHGFRHRPYGDLVGSGLHQMEEAVWLSSEARARGSAAAASVVDDIYDNLADRTAKAGRTRVPSR